MASWSGWVAGTRYQAADTADAVSSATAGYTAAVLAILYIRKLSGMQETKQHALAGQYF
ncbi:hypothetical protein G5C51_11030 [Streptomyces sp. A7024]|uniref:Uncharacterized protein n=1 Tax=Streptomyces coryli TaxID=1128680 RepID=A0A6G4TX90_9ACTN|nr:hypothetical protein [Streptomyces coryli]NGN64433.1 hypothetical protein [Streptomyces coryli]